MLWAVDTVRSKNHKADIVGFDGRYYLSAARGSLRAVIRGERSGGEPRNGTRGFDKARSGQALGAREGRGTIRVEGAETPVDHAELPPLLCLY